MEKKLYYAQDGTQMTAAEVMADAWISVKDAVPEDWQDVIVFCVDGNLSWIQIAALAHGEWKIDYTSDMATVTHWMPLPALTASMREV